MLKKITYMADQFQDCNSAAQEDLNVLAVREKEKQKVVLFERPPCLSTLEISL